MLAPIPVELTALSVVRIYILLAGSCQQLTTDQDIGCNHSCRTCYPCQHLSMAAACRCAGQCAAAGLAADRAADPAAPVCCVQDCSEGLPPVGPGKDNAVRLLKLSTYSCMAVLWGLHSLHV